MDADSEEEGGEDVEEEAVRLEFQGPAKEIANLRLDWLRISNKKYTDLLVSTAFFFL